MARYPNEIGFAVLKMQKVLEYILRINMIMGGVFGLKSGLEIFWMTVLESEMNEMLEFE